MEETCGRLYKNFIKICLNFLDFYTNGLIRLWKYLLYLIREQLNGNSKDFITPSRGLKIEKSLQSSQLS